MFRLICVTCLILRVKCFICRNFVDLTSLVSMRCIEACQVFLGEDGKQKRNIKKFRKTFTSRKKNAFRSKLNKYNARLFEWIEPVHQTNNFYCQTKTNNDDFTRILIVFFFLIQFCFDENTPKLIQKYIAELNDINIARMSVQICTASSYKLALYFPCKPWYSV